MNKFVLLPFFLFACVEADKDGEPIEDTGPDEPEIIDSDGDGFDSTEDCNDSDATINPGAPELCDGLDNNCDEQIDEGVTGEWFQDLDGDGFGNPDVMEEAWAGKPSKTSSPCNLAMRRASEAQNVVGFLISALERGPRSPSMH